MRRGDAPLHPAWGLPWWALVDIAAAPPPRGPAGYHESVVTCGETVRRVTLPFPYPHPGMINPTPWVGIMSKPVACEAVKVRARRGHAASPIV
ncbi:hypothetical protein GCM10022630_24570 [Thermobifida alba]